MLFCNKFLKYYLCNLADNFNQKNILTDTFYFLGPWVQVQVQVLVQVEVQHLASMVVAKQERQ